MKANFVLLLLPGGLHPVWIPEMLDFEPGGRGFNSPHDVGHHSSAGKGVGEVYIRKLSWPLTPELALRLWPALYKRMMWIPQSDCDTRREISDICTRIRTCIRILIFEEIEIRNPLLVPIPFPI